MTQNWIIALPFGISCWWNILIGPIGSTIVVVFLASKKLKKVGDLVLGLGAGLVFGLVISLGAGLVFGPVFGLVVSMGFSLVFGLVFGPVFGLVFGLVVSMVFGLVFGPVISLGFSMVFILVFGLVALIKWVTSTSSWTKVWDWLLVR